MAQDRDTMQSDYAHLLTLWTSGEVELDWGSSPADTHCEHREVLDPDDLDRCVDLLAARVRECVG